MAIALLIRRLDLIRIFDVVWALTQGGLGTMTETLSIYIYIQAVGHAVGQAVGQAVEATRRESATNANIPPEHGVGLRLTARF